MVGAGGLIQPGDFVDVLVVLSTKSTTDVGGEQVSGVPIGKARVLLQNVQVLAVAQRVSGALFTQEADGTARLYGQSPQSTEPDPKAKTVTLSVTVSEAQQLFLGEELGVLKLAVRPAGDSEIQPASEATMSWSEGEQPVEGQ